MERYDEWRKTGELSALGTRLGIRLHFALCAEVWMSPVVPEDYQEYGIIFDIIQNVIRKSSQVGTSETARVIMMAPWIPLDGGGDQVKFQPERGQDPL